MLPTRLGLLLAVLSVGLAASAGAQEGLYPTDHSISDQMSGIEGYWHVERRDWGGPGKHERDRVTLSAGRRQTCTAAFAEDCVYSLIRPADGRIRYIVSANFAQYKKATAEINNDGAIAFSYGYQVLGYYAGSEHLRQVGPDELRGEWRYHGSTGLSIWRRARPEIRLLRARSDITSELAPGGGVVRVEETFDSFQWSDRVSSRGNRPSFVIEILGDDIWGADHIVDLGGEPGLEPRPPRAIYDGNGGNTNSHIVGYSVQIVIWPRARPGRKTLYFDGEAIPFDFVVDGHPDSQALAERAGGHVDLRFVRFPALPEGGYDMDSPVTIESIVERQLFWIVADYRGPELPWDTLELKVRDRGLNVNLDVEAALWRGAGDRKEFIAGPFYPVRENTAQGEAGENR